MGGGRIIKLLLTSYIEYVHSVAKRREKMGRRCTDHITDECELEGCIGPLPRHGLQLALDLALADGCRRDLDDVIAVGLAPEGEACDKDDSSVGLAVQFPWQESSPPLFASHQA